MRPGDTSWLDHCISSQDGHNIIKDMYVDYKLSCRDCRPMFMDLDLGRLPTVEEESNDISPRIKWDKYEAYKRI